MPTRDGRAWRRAVRVLWGALLLAGALAIAVPIVGASMLAWLESALLYFPTREVAYPTAALGPDAEDVWFGEQARLHGLFVPGPPDLTILHFHGNAGNVSHRVPLLLRLRAELDANIFAIDYQGYGRSAGRPSERATAADARAALAYLQSRPGLDPSRIVYFGESLGGAVAIDLAAEAPPFALVAQSPFTSLADLTRLHYPLLAPLLPFAQNRYDALATIRRVQAPLLVIHGAADTIVPVEHGRRIFAAANEPKRLLVVPGADHNDLLVRGGAALWQALREHVGRAGGPAGE